MDRATADLIRVEVSDGIIAPGYEEGTVEMMAKKKGGDYKVLQIDPTYEADEVESRQLFGLTLEQARNNFVPGDDYLNTIVTKNGDLTDDARRDLLVATIAVKYTQSNSVVAVWEGQVVGAGAVLAFSFVVTLIIGIVIQKTIGFRISDDDEVTGIDNVVHAESGYDFASLGSSGSTARPSCAQNSICPAMDRSATAAVCRASNTNSPESFTG